ncbi:asparagine synthase (glutamine-hydrolyzing) [Verrucomicrobiota bacterium]
MCGIFGILGFEEGQIDRARKALHSLKPRGPDQWGEWYDSKTYLGHRRLSIIDLSEDGRQPMAAGGVVIAVNGEIYNFVQLREQLSGEYEFRSESDSEVVLHGYREWGIDGLLRRLDGMYAMAIYDKAENQLYLVRDRYGKKPMYYSQANGRVLFASEIKAMLEFDDRLRVFSYDGIRRWIYHRGSHCSGTIFHNVHKLRPGTYLRAKGGKISETRYYDSLDESREWAEPDAVGRLEDLLDRAVAKRLVSDVPIGLQLSGGVDSSLIGHFLRRHHSGEMHTFSIGFGEPEYQQYSEEKYARFAADKLGFTHHQLNITMGDAVQAYEKAVYLCDGMLDFPNTIPIHLLSLYAKDYVTVMITGEGADELFGGYTKFRTVEALQHPRPWSKAVPDVAIRLLGNGRLRRYARAMYLAKKYGGSTREILDSLNCYIHPDTFTAIFGRRDFSLYDEIPYDRISQLPFFRQAIIVDHKTYLFSVLDRQDRASMGAAIESRLPFMDQDLVAQCMSLPKQYLYDSRENKRLLKTLCAEVFGSRFTYRRKMGFPLPLNDWIDRRDAFAPHVDKVFQDDFALAERLDMAHLSGYLDGTDVDRHLLNYGDSDRIWVKWFLMTLRATQDIFRISAVR